MLHRRFMQGSGASAQSPKRQIPVLMQTHFQGLAAQGPFSRNGGFPWLSPKRHAIHMSWSGHGLWTGQSCAMAFKEGPGYHFTSASFLTPPPHGVLAKTGKTNFLYIPFKDYKGPDSYAIKICATVQGRKGCSSLTYVVDVQ